MKITPTQYAKALVALSRDGGDASQIAASFLSFVKKRRGSKKLPEIVRAAEALSDEKDGRISLLAETAIEADDAMRKDIAKNAATLFPGKDVSLCYVVRPDIIGGVRFSSNDEVVDGSIRARLRAMKKQMGSKE
ncbi:MAG: F0F1 ATP synthase subunit delta [Candidatus Moranbacteria bacterium]|nr:F0F1 ATP synthase subunit delta [Candidatus Moranbacteria bacterium]